VTRDSFMIACDRVSQAVDSGLFERLRWARTEGPMLARLVDLAQATLEDRTEMELTEEGSSNDTKRFVLKVHGTRVIAIVVALKDGQALVWAEEIERSRYRVAEGDPFRADYALVDAAWMNGAFESLFDRIAA